MAEKQKRGNKERKKLITHPLPHATVRRLILSIRGNDKQIAGEAVEVASEFWEHQIQEWTEDYLSEELEQINSNPNKPKGQCYIYRRVTGLMVTRAIQKWKEGGIL